MATTWDTTDYGFGGSVSSALSKDKPDYSGWFDKSKDSAVDTAWKTGFDTKGGGKGISDLYENLFDKAKSSDKYRSQFESSSYDPFGRTKRGGVYGGDWGKTGSSQLAENLWAYESPKLSPLVLEGSQGSPGFFGSGGGKALAGIAGLALAPVTGGASLMFAPMVGQAAEAAGRTWNV
jgi:hypothetical protein